MPLIYELSRKISEHLCNGDLTKSKSFPKSKINPEFFTGRMGKIQPEIELFALAQLESSSKTIGSFGILDLEGTIVLKM